MRFKLDENIDVRAEAALSGAGHDVATVVGQDLGGATDPAIAEAVEAEGRVLVTLDRRFADLRAYPPGSHPGIVVLRLRRQGLASVTAALELLAAYEGLAGMGGCIVIVSDAACECAGPSRDPATCPLVPRSLT